MPSTTQQPPADLPILPFPTADAFTTFLDTNHLTSPGIYLKLAKKSTGIPSVTSAEAVECALCYGWIDGRANSIDETWWTMRFTPRRKKSVWSKKNVDTVGRLIAEGRMTKAGMDQVNQAKEDGRWERAYAGPAGMVVPDDFLELLERKGNEMAKEVWEGLGKSARYPMLHRMDTASVKAREGVVERLVESLREGKVPGAAGEGNKKTAPSKTATKTKIAKDRVEKKTPKKESVVKLKTASTRAPKEKPTTNNSSQSRRPGLRTRP